MREYFTSFFPNIRSALATFFYFFNVNTCNYEIPGRSVECCQNCKGYTFFSLKKASNKERLIRWGIRVPHSPGLPEKKIVPLPITLHGDPLTTELESPGQSMGCPQFIFLSPLTSYKCWLREVVRSTVNNNHVLLYQRELNFSSPSVAGGKASLILGNNFRKPNIA